MNISSSLHPKAQKSGLETCESESGESDLSELMSTTILPALETDRKKIPAVNTLMQQQH